MAEKIVEDVYKVKGEGNVYIILKPEVMVIDCSDNRDMERIKEEIEEIVKPEDVKKVLLTHLHFDHVGNLELFSGAEVYVSKGDIDGYRKNPNDFFLFNVSGKTKEMIEGAKVLPKEINSLKVIDVPGHTRGSVAFLDEKRRLLFSGDTLFNNGIGRIDFPNSEPGKMKSSVEKLMDLIKQKDLKLCCGHDY